MDLRDLIADAQKLYDDASDEVETLLLAITDKRAEMAQLEEELHGLRLAASRHGGLDSDDLAGISSDAVGEGPSGNVVPLKPEHGAARTAHDISALNRSEAVMHVLSTTNRPLDRQGIQTRLMTFGRIGETADQISLALTNLKRSGRVIKVGNGRWRVVKTSAIAGR